MKKDRNKINDEIFLECAALNRAAQGKFSASRPTKKGESN
jgi:hypothetical protein